MIFGVNIITKNQTVKERVPQSRWLLGTLASQVLAFQTPKDGAARVWESPGRSRWGKQAAEPTFQREAWAPDH